MDRKRSGGARFLLRHRSRGQALGLLYLCCGGVAVLRTLLPHGGPAGDEVVLTMALLAIGLGGTLVVLGRKLPTVGQHAVIAVIQLVIATAYVAQGRPSSLLALFWLWATPYAALFFAGRAALAHGAWTTLVVCVSLALMPADTLPEAPARALLLVSTLVATGLLVHSAAAVMRRAEAAQRRAAAYDVLTGAGNRRLLLDPDTPGTLGAWAAAPAERPSALLLLDLDEFKAANDRHGHALGDALLQEAATALRRTVAPADVVCRLGGDEFAVVLNDLGAPAERRALETAWRCVRAVTDAAAALAPQVMVGASAGVRVLDDPALTTSAALSDVDDALYAAKRAGRGRAMLWCPDLAQSDDAEQLEMARDLVAVLTGLPGSGQVSLRYQPVVDVRDGRVRGLEALARWDHPVRGAVDPALFVRCAERAGTVPVLTRWVLQTACRDAVRWPVASDGSRINAAINLSATQLADLVVVDDVAAALRESGLPANRLVLEVTETAEVADLGRARLTLEALAAAGTLLALDDFGTGHANLTAVVALPFDILKVDRSFVQGAADGDRRALATVAAVAALAGQLGLDLVAEGVEKLDALDPLHGLGFRYAQGFALAPPMTPEAVHAALAGAGPDGWFVPVSRPRVPVPEQAGALSSP